MTEGQKMTRAEWMAVAALVLNFGTIAFVAGQVMQTQADHDRRLSIEERKSDNLIPRIERIDANVAMLAEQAREQRENERGRK
jgi:hypothetical protein